MELQEFKIYKTSGTYSELLEAYGLANLLDEIHTRNETIGVKITIEDNGGFYRINLNKPLTDEIVNSLKYFPIFKFIKKGNETVIPEGVIDYYDYTEQKKLIDNYKERFNAIDKNKTLTQEQKRQSKKDLNKEKLSEFGKKIDPEFDVYREIQGNPYASFTKLFENFHLHQKEFCILIKEILYTYSQQQNEKRAFKLKDENPTAQQLYNPFQGKGLNKSKANNASMGNLNSNWVSESMKISGALSMMVCQYVKVGSSYDLKIFVPEFNQISYNQSKQILFDFKKNLKSASPVKLDIINIIDLSHKFIQRTPEYNKGKIKDTIKGFHAAYLKDLGQNKAVANLAFINTPDFIEYKTKEEGREWIEILEEQKRIISGIEELGDSIQGLQAYRDFLGSTGQLAIDKFNKFSYWYGNYLTQAISKEKYYVRPFQTETLNKFYINMDTQELNLTEIIKNDGFQAVATAIRKSTISLQYTPKDQRKFEIRYGLAQQLQNKSKSKEDLATFIGEFIGVYNAETGRFAEKNEKKPEPPKAPRATVKDGELLEFYQLLDKNSPRLIGALLSSYGFALTSRENVPNQSDNDSEFDNEENQ
ncbi:MAG: hypothetical protein LCH44_13825 [Bacteroidetes bacterium]|jgi:hypothetical protein|nr:hypothetical protein [Bacteroidota bacterium]MCA9488223.1 hypothetical protein [Nanoarchaeota archaeon]MCO5278560.1 hypothetical protein [Saprospiraceae bacterium]